MQKKSRVQGATQYIDQNKHEKLVKITTIVTFVYVFIFIGIQGLLMFLCVANLVSTEAFQAELNACIFILMLCLNIYALVSYCRNAGSPYLNDKYRKYVRKYKVVVVIWNFAFILKFILSIFGQTIFYQNDSKSEENDFWYSVITFCNIMFTEIVPFYFVLDKKIIKIFTLKFLEPETEEAVDYQGLEQN